MLAALNGVLEADHLEARMINGRQTRNLPGRKTDVVSGQWGATPHMHGLLKAGFVPPADIRRLQDYLRLRGDHVTAAASCVQLMQKALGSMNIKLHYVSPHSPAPVAWRSCARSWLPLSLLCFEIFAIFQLNAT